MENINLADLKDHPFFHYLLTLGARQEMEKFYSNIANGESVYNSPVIKLLDAIISRKTFRMDLPRGTMLYRARAIVRYDQFKMGIDQKNDGTFSGYNEQNSIEAPLHKTPEARANIKGMSYLYLAEDKYTACAEIRPANNSFVSVATFKTLKKASLIDLTIKKLIANKDMSEFSDIEEKLQLSVAEMAASIMRRFATPAIDTSIYASTQFISDYFRKAGVDGIQFQSAMSGGTNISLFNSHNSRIKFVKSQIVAVYSQFLNIIDMDYGSIIDSPIDSTINPNYFENTKEELGEIIHRVHTQKE